MLPKSKEMWPCRSSHLQLTLVGYQVSALDLVSSLQLKYCSGFLAVVEVAVKLYCVLKLFLFLFNGMKGVFSKPSGNLIVAPIFRFQSQRLQILATCLFFDFLNPCKVSERLDNIDVIYFQRVPPLMFFDFVIYQKFKGGTLRK